MALAMFASHRQGHWWGDDWALYVRQAEALLDGHTGRVSADNRFTVETSRGPAFSPPLYPWGFPLLLAPFVAVVGPDLDRLAVVPVLSASAFACAWFALARPRVGRAAALVGVVAVTITPLLLGWSELIQSEWPFLAVTGLTLAGLDRLVAAGAIAAPTARLGPPIVLGIGAAAAFSVRREGLAVLAAITAAQLVALASASPRPWRLTRPVVSALSIRIATPYVAALGAILALQLLLPSTLVPRYTGTSIANVWRFSRDHVEHLAEVSGLKQAAEPDPTVFGNAMLGWIVVIAYLATAAAGIILALTLHRRRDAHLVAYAAAAFVIGASFRIPVNRYVCSVAPLMLLFCLVAVASLARWVGRRRGELAAMLAATSLVLLLAGANGYHAWFRVDRARTFAEAGSVEWGPTHPDAIAMLEAVARLTDPGDVVAAPKARAMTLLTGRRAVQADDHRPLPDDVELALVVVEPSSELAGELTASGSGYELVWRNQRFLLLQPSSAASAST